MGSEGKEGNVDKGRTKVSSYCFSSRDGVKWDTKCSNKRSGEDNTLTFFLTSFDDKVREKDFYEALKVLRDIDEVIIPSKRHKRGNKYSFVWFFNVGDERTLPTKWITRH